MQLITAYVTKYGKSWLRSATKIYPICNMYGFKLYEWNYVLLKKIGAVYCIIRIFGKKRE